MRRTILKYMMIPLTAVALAFSGTAQPANAIVGGTFPTDADGMAAIFVSGEYTCTGTLVSDYWVLTAKHCLYGWPDDFVGRFVDSQITVRVRSVYYSTGGSLIQVSKSKVRTSHDIAMLKLSKSAAGKPVRLATANTSVGSSDNAFGWGVSCATCSYAPGLKRAEMVVTSTSSPDAVPGKGYTGDLAGGRAIRAKWGDGQICDGDSGGPLFHVVNGLRYQVGVTSWSTPRNNCTTPSSYFAYVPDSRTWIQNVIATE